MSILIAACDGSALGNPGPGGWSFYIHDSRWAAGGHPGPVTNNLMELTALLRLLEHADGEHLSIHIDSQYALNAVTKWCHGWRRNGWRTSSGGDVANKDIIVQIVDLLEQRNAAGLTTDFTWVRGHNGHPANEAADQRARAAAEEARSSGKALIRRAG